MHSRKELEILKIRIKKGVATPKDKIRCRELQDHFDKYSFDSESDIKDINNTTDSVLSKTSGSILSGQTGMYAGLQKRLGLSLNSNDRVIDRVYDRINNIGRRNET